MPSVFRASEPNHPSLPLTKPSELNVDTPWGWRHIGFLQCITLIKSYYSFGCVINVYKEEKQLTDSSGVLLFEGLSLQAQLGASGFI